ncbi:hypothetical protein FRB95_013403 [Tulasnella sp. JGI-2019a]|nr:hypothetical protein FRB95_013403 [Tulasnella sp. JGI-2019a]
MSDGLFCWRLYVIWSRNTRTILLPTLLLVVTAIGYIMIVATDFLLAAQPHNLRYLTLNMSLFIWVPVVVLAYTCYITIFIVGRLWWVGGAINRLSILEEKRRNGYQAVMTAIVQSGVMNCIISALTIVSAATMNITMMTMLGSINPPLGGICATLLVLQLNMYRGQPKRPEDSKLPAITGATIHFANPQGLFSSVSAESTQSPVIRRRRASTATCHHRECEKDVADTSGQLVVTFPTCATTTNDQDCVPIIPYSSTISIQEGKEPSLA